jgi:hypothetical protein
MMECSLNLLFIFDASYDIVKIANSLTLIAILA